MTEYAEININALEVNCENDRHEPFSSEKEAIEWFMRNKPDDMKNLLRDIIFEGGILEPPLVMKSGDKYRVYDGNRRVTCMKLLLLKELDIAPELHAIVKSIIDDNDRSINDAIECRVETDIETINKLLERRHIPGQSGAGQVNWDNHQKENFYKRTKQYRKIGFATKINDILIKKGYLTEDERINLSIFERLFSNKENRERIGFNINADGEVELIKNEAKVFKALAHIARDIIAGKRTLSDFWNNERKEEYFDELGDIIPKAETHLAKPTVFKYSDWVVPPFPFTKGSKPKKTRKPKKTTFPSDFPTPTVSKFSSKKFCDLFSEFGKLSLRSRTQTICVVFRTILELPTDSYIRKHDIEVTGNTQLATRINMVTTHLIKRGVPLTDATKSYIKKLSNNKEFESINTLHKAVHSDLMLSENQIETMINNFNDYLRNLIEDL